VFWRPLLGVGFLGDCKEQIVKLFIDGPLGWRSGRANRQELLESLQQKFAELATDACPFDPPPPAAVRRTARWVRPELVCEVAFAEWTFEGIVRQASFLALRDDKDPHDVVLEPDATGLA